MRSLQLDLSASLTSSSDREELPPLAALFLIYFDTKAGYTISWKKTAPGVSLDGVEFKSLPSGLHNLKEDLVYFVHGPYAGVSAFVNVAAAAEERNALMLSLGILVPLSYGRLGRGWLHAESLKSLAQKFATNTADHGLFEEYYERHKVQEIHHVPEDAPVETVTPTSGVPRTAKAPGVYGRARSVSEVTTAVVPGQVLSPFHPARSLLEFMDTFGPLIFPLYRAALARKRILILTDAPVEPACNFVYDISILSNIPLSVAHVLPIEPYRLKPLFSVGIHDIPFLEEQAKQHRTLEGDRGAWVACSTDNVLQMKADLYDIVIVLPHAFSKDAKKKVWPKVESPDGTPLQATQRDLRRYRTLKRLLRRAHSSRPFDRSPDDNDSVFDDDSEDEPSGIEDTCEKLTWREIAYTGYLWWASAGEKRADEEGLDEDLFFDRHSAQYAPYPRDDDSQDAETPPPQSEGFSRSASVGDGAAASVPHRRRSFRRRRSTTLTSLRRYGLSSPEMDVIAYFHRLTHRILSVLSEAVAATVADASEEAVGEEEGEEGEGGDADETPLLPRGPSNNGAPDEDEDEQEPVIVSLDDVDRMGLDRYSDLDSAFVRECGERWFGRVVEVERWRVNCCGIECG